MLRETDRRGKLVPRVPSLGPSTNFQTSQVFQSVSYSIRSVLVLHM